MIPGSANALLLVTADTGYNIERSLRFNSSDSAYLSRTPASAGNRKTWTWAGWVKKATNGNVLNSFFAASTPAYYDGLTFGYNNADTLALNLANSAGNGNDYGPAFETTQVFRDPSAWYHIVLAIDTTQSTASNRVRVYVNGTQITTFATTNYPAQNYETNDFNTAQIHYLGAAGGLFGGRFFDGYLADIYFIDGQALTPSSFTETDATTGQLIPKAYTGSYGTNGFHLDFADNASTTTIGYDAAGSNDWTANNLSVTAGAGNDSLVDVPTNGAQTDTGVGGEVRGNYATLNPLTLITTSGSLKNGNLELDGVANDSDTIASATIAVNSGKWYWEVTALNSSGTISANQARGRVGIKPISDASTVSPGSSANSYSYLTNGQKINNSTLSNYGTAINTNNVVGVALDLDAGTLTYYLNNVSQGTAFSSLPSTLYIPSVAGAGNNSSVVMQWACNFGQRPFAYTAPSGFKALNTANLPAPAVVKSNTVFDVKLYTGNGSTQTISGLAFSPDLVWIKERNASADHALYDAVRGATKQLESNTTTDETTEATGLTAFNSDGFALGALAQVNTSTDTYVAWAWNESVSAGFDIVTYTGNGSARTISHSLGVVPSLIIVKARTTASTDQGWPVYHSANTAAPETDYLLLNSTAATADLDTVWNDTAPTSSVFSVGTNALVNANNDTYVAYCFAPVVGYSSFGSYTGNGSTDGPFVYTGFRPRWVLIKNTSTSADWCLFDTARDTYNQSLALLNPNLSGAESILGSGLDILSNGFKLRRDASPAINNSGNTFVFAAFAEHPFQYARAR
jgi:hypothetical protein